VSSEDAEHPIFDGEAAAAEPQPSAAFVGAFVSLRLIQATWRRRRRLWRSLAAAGLLVGLFAAVALPKKDSATTTLLLNHLPGADPTDAMQTDVALLQTPAVAQKALTILGLHETAQVFATQYTGLAVSDEVLQITLVAGSPAEATREANGVAKAFLEFRTSQFEAQTNAVNAALSVQVSNLTARINVLEKAIKKLSTAAAQPLINLQDQDISEQQQVNQAIQTQIQNTSTVIDGSFVLVTATPNHVSHLKVLIIDSLSGLIAGLAIGLGGLATAVALSDRIRRRDDFASALDAPVELSLGRFPKHRRPLLEGLRPGGPDVALLARYLQTKLPLGQGRSVLAVTSIDSLTASAEGVAALARMLATAGRRVGLVDLSVEGRLAGLLGVERTGASVAHLEGAANPVSILVPAGGWPAEVDDARDAARWPPGLRDTEGRRQLSPSLEVVLVLATLDPAVGAEHLAAWAEETVVVVTAGRSSAAKVRTQAEMIQAAGMTLLSAVLVNADRDDQSLGRAVDTSFAMAVSEFPEVAVTPVGSARQS
jgi:Mrp family chromosome partitioning ATPase